MSESNFWWTYTYPDFIKKNTYLRREKNEAKF